MKYAKSLNSNRIFILSAKYGLLNLKQKIKPYDLTLNNMKSKERKEWSKKVLKSLSLQTNLKKDKFIFLAGEKYRRYLISEISNFEIPMKNLPIGKQLQWLKIRCENV